MLELINYTTNNQFIILGSSLILGLIVSIACTITSKCTKNMTFSLLFLPILVTVAMMVVNGNIGAGLATVGIFSLVRFRSVPGNSKDIINVFFGVVVGLINTTGCIIISLIITIIISLIMIIASKILFKNEEKYQLKITIPEIMNCEEIFIPILNQYFIKYKLIQAKTAQMGTVYEYTYEVLPKNNINIQECLDAIRVKNGNLNVSYCPVIPIAEL